MTLYGNLDHPGFVKFVAMVESRLAYRVTFVLSCAVRVGEAEELTHTLISLRGKPLGLAVFKATQ